MDSIKLGGNMKIRKTNMDDLNAVMKIYEIEIKFMAENNNPNQ